MIYSDLTTLARIKANEKIASNAVTNIDVGYYVNARYMRASSAVLEVNRDYYGAIDTTIDFVNGTASYALPDLDSAIRTRVMSIDRIEMAYSSGNYIEAKTIDIMSLPDTSTASLMFSTQNPRYALFGSTLYVYPTPTANVTDAVKMWYQRRPLRMTSDSESPNLPDEFHEIIAFGAAADIISSAIDPGYAVNVSELEAQWDDGLKAMLKALSPRDASEMPVVHDRTGYSTYAQEDYVEPGSLTLS